MVQFSTPPEQDSEPIHYLVEWTEPALIEADAAYLRFSQYAGPENAILWYEGLFVTGETLSSLPRANPIAPENGQYSVEVRRLLYYGPSKWRGGQVYRLLFYIIEPQQDESLGVVRIMHVWHGAKGPTN